jgi:hypothetical protein
VIDPVSCGSDSYAINYNGGQDTTYNYTNASMTLHAPYGNLNGGSMTVKGACTPFVSVNGQPPTAISLAPVAPNPAAQGTPSLHVMYTIPDEAPVSLDLFNALGVRVRQVVSESQKQGEYQLDVAADDLPQGVYILRLESGGKLLTRRVVFGQ